MCVTYGARQRTEEAAALANVVSDEFKKRQQQQGSSLDRGRWGGGENGRDDGRRVLAPKRPYKPCPIANPREPALSWSYEILPTPSISIVMGPRPVAFSDSPWMNESDSNFHPYCIVHRLTFRVMLETVRVFMVVGGSGHLTKILLV